MTRKQKRTNAQWAREPRVLRARLVAVQELRARGYSYKEIAMALYTTPDRVRTLEARARRLVTALAAKFAAIQAQTETTL